MKVTVDSDICIGCGMCAGIATDVFEMNEDMKATALDTVTLENKDMVEEVINACPVCAIAWKNE